jgi:hypothetical protein
MPEPLFGALLKAQEKLAEERTMYRMDEMDLWTQRRHELASESGRLARSPKVAAWFRGVLFSRVLEAPVNLHAESGGRA